MAGGLERGEIRLYHFPAAYKARPVVILTRGEALRYLGRVTVAPITSTIRGVASEVLLDTDDGMKQPSVVNLHNIMTVAKTGIGRRVAKLSDEKLESLCRAIAFSLGCEGP